MTRSYLVPDINRVFRELRGRIERLERKQQPVTETTSSGGGGLTPVRLLAEAALTMGAGVPGTQTLYQMAELPPLDGSGDPYIKWGDTCPVNLTAGPYTSGAGGEFLPTLFLPGYMSDNGLTVTFHAKILVWNAAVTQRLRATYSSVTRSATWTPNSSSAAPSTDMAIGSDLSVGSNQRIKTTAGGVFLASVQFLFSDTPPAELVSIG